MEFAALAGGAARAGEALPGANSLTEVSDRESDIFEHFARRPTNVELLVEPVLIGGARLTRTIVGNSSTGSLTTCRKPVASP